MDSDDLEPIIKPKIIDFDTLSIEELKEYISDLEKEILKVRQYIKSKKQDRSMAENLFKKKESPIRPNTISVCTLRICNIFYKPFSLTSPDMP